MSVRPRLAKDLPGCIRALATVHAADGYPSWWPADPAEWLTAPGLAGAWVIEHAGTIAGHVGMSRGVEDAVVTALTGAPRHRLASLTRLFVAPAARGHRLGTLLIDAVHGYAATQGLQLMLDVVDGGPAVALYDQLGWRVADHRLADWTTPEGHRLPVRVYLSPEVDLPAVP